jgi:hypothetical protein
MVAPDSQKEADPSRPYGFLDALQAGPAETSRAAQTMPKNLGSSARTAASIMAEGCAV